MAHHSAGELAAALDAELKKQEDEEMQNSFNCVEAVRSFIEETNSDKIISIALRMCVLDFERIDTDKATRLTLIDAESGHHFKAIRAKFDRLDELRRKQFIFHLTVWDPRKKKGSGIKERFRAGGVYDFKKIHSVRFFAEIAQGSLQSIDPATDKGVQEVSLLQGNKRRSLSEESSGSLTVKAALLWMMGSDSCQRSTLC